MIRMDDNIWETMLLCVACSLVSKIRNAKKCIDMSEVPQNFPTVDGTPSTIANRPTCSRSSSPFLFSLAFFFSFLEVRWKGRGTTLTRLMASEVG